MNDIIKSYIDMYDSISNKFTKFELFDMYFERRSKKTLEYLICWDTRYIYTILSKFISIFNFDPVTEYDLFMAGVMGLIKSINEYDKKYTYKQLCAKIKITILQSIQDEVVKEKLCGAHINSADFFTLYRSVMSSNNKNESKNKKFSNMFGSSKIVYDMLKMDNYRYDRIDKNEYIPSRSSFNEEVYQYENEMIIDKIRKIYDGLSERDKMIIDLNLIDDNEPFLFDGDFKNVVDKVKSKLMEA